MAADGAAGGGERNAAHAAARASHPAASCARTKRAHVDVAVRSAETIPGTLQWPDETAVATQYSHARNTELAALVDAERGSLSHRLRRTCRSTSGGRAGIGERSPRRSARVGRLRCFGRRWAPRAPPACGGRRVWAWQFRRQQLTAVAAQRRAAAAVPRSDRVTLPAR